MKRLVKSAALFDPRSMIFSVGRSLLALAQLGTILFTSDRDLIFNTPHPDGPGLCEGIEGISAWCVTGGDQASNPAARMVALAVLAAVAIGAKPRWLCIPHWYISFSIATSVTVADGGAAIAEVASGLLIPQCLGDTRLTHWSKVETQLAPRWRGSSYAAHLVLRLQVAIIYLDAAFAKASHSAWRDGQALRIIMQGPQFGAPDAVRGIVVGLLRNGWVGPAVTWSVLIIETGIAVSMFCATAVRRYALVGAVVLHFFIMILMGLFAFALTMMAVIALASLNTSPRKVSTSADRNQPVRSVVRL
ncbi:HTTM domain-containing protein [Catenulispora sp. NF23]|uniref:HTTM domain-containing protein n=1 Tax=Catenulispora pinistramenti TaxID=2705254 RepID=UPI001BAC3225|nr:HTTM domain-containing protein [Catenulispora pinistramenti]MBS2531653.1 HTTM domain-containing protein [Catenulispora pinistramenti]